MGQAASQRTRHRLVEHTGDVELEVTAPSYAELFAEAGRALGALMAGEHASRAEGTAEPVLLHSQDVASLLVEWLNELIYLSETRKRVYTEVTVAQVNDRVLQARVRGIALEALKTPVKAATLHRLALTETEDGFLARVVLDV